MQFSIKRLRWVLLAGVLLLLAVLTAFIGYGRYRAMALYTKLIKHSGATISHDTSGFTYSQTEKGKTIFTLHAAKATQLGEGKWSLHDVAVTLYGRSESTANTRTDYITGSEFTYDEKEGIVRAIGEVHMDLQAPQSLTAGGHASSAAAPLPTLKANESDTKSESADVVHVRTSGLVYLRKLGLAATDQEVEFHYHGIECTALGAEFNSSQSTIRLLSDVVASGLVRDQRMVVHASSVDIDRIANVTTLAHVVAQSQGRTGTADVTNLNLRKDGSIDSALSTGHVTFTSKTQKVSAPQFETTLTPQNTLRTARLSGGVVLIDTNPLRPIQGAASTADIAFDPHGSLTSITAEGTAQSLVKLSLLDKRSSPRGLQRNLQGTRVVAFFAPAASVEGSRSHTDSQLTQVHIVGSANARSEAIAKMLRPLPLKQFEPQTKTTTISGDDLQLTFVPGADGKSQPQNLLANGHTVLQQDAPLGEQEISSGEKLSAVFGSSGANGSGQLDIVSALQTGHVKVHRTAPLKPSFKPTTNSAQQDIGSASAEQASYDGATEKLTLSGNANLTQDNTSLTAALVILNQRTQDADASGNVQATLENPSAPGSALSATNTRASQFTHVLSASAHFTHETKQAEFYGTDAAPAKMWQAGSQVQAATLSLDGVRHTFSARTAAPGALIHAVLAAAPAATPTQNPLNKPSGQNSVLRVASARMDYSDIQRQAAFSGPAGVLIEGDAGTIRAQRAVAYLSAAQPAAAKPTTVSASPTPFNGSLDHVVITGDVQLDQPGRHGTGDQLVYTAVTGNSVLTGSLSHPPHIVDAQQGSVTGASLLFGDAGSTIVVSGESEAAKPGRVHTETHLQNRKEERQ
jgi:lipopolysaccharide export system protein LptA